MFCFLGISLLYKDNYPYVVIEIYFHFCLCLGSVIISGILCSFIFHILSLWWFFILFVLYVIIYHRLCDKDYHWLMIIFFLFYVFVLGYGYIILVIWGLLDYLYHRTGIYFILWCDIPFLFVFFWDTNVCDYIILILWSLFFGWVYIIILEVWWALI